MLSIKYVKAVKENVGSSGGKTHKSEQNESTLFWSCISLPLLIRDMDYTLQTLSLFILFCLFTHSEVEFYRL